MSRAGSLLREDRHERKECAAIGQITLLLAWGLVEESARCIGALLQTARFVPLHGFNEPTNHKFGFWHANREKCVPDYSAKSLTTYNQGPLFDHPVCRQRILATVLFVVTSFAEGFSTISCAGDGPS